MEKQQALEDMCLSFTEGETTVVAMRSRGTQLILKSKAKSGFELHSQNLLHHLLLFLCRTSICIMTL